MHQLGSELEAFNGLALTRIVHVITDAYNRIVAIVQRLMLSTDDPNSRGRACRLLNDNAYKYLSEIQEGSNNTLDDLKHKMAQVCQTLMSS